MDNLVALLRTLPLEVFETPQSNDAWERSPLTRISDALLIQSVAAAIATPKAEASSSFLLHAPLELLARAWLLPYVSGDKRDNARRRIAEIAVRYAGEGTEVETPPRDYATVDSALVELLGALRAGDVDTVDGTLLFLQPRVPLERLRAAVAEEIIPALGAAGHAPILLMELAGAVRYGCASVGALLRAPLRAVALEADWRLTWMDSVDSLAVHHEASLFESLVAPPMCWVSGRLWARCGSKRTYFALRPNNTRRWETNWLHAPRCMPMRTLQSTLWRVSWLPRALRTLPALSCCRGLPRGLVGLPRVRHVVHNGVAQRAVICEGVRNCDVRRKCFHVHREKHGRPEQPGWPRHGRE